LMVRATSCIFLGDMRALRVSDWISMLLIP
jgi:hypothetical protein